VSSLDAGSPVDLFHVNVIHGTYMISGSKSVCELAVEMERLLRGSAVSSHGGMVQIICLGMYLHSLRELFVRTFEVRRLWSCTTQYTVICSRTCRVHRRRFHDGQYQTCTTQVPRVGTLGCESAVLSAFHWAAKSLVSPSASPWRLLPAQCPPRLQTCKPCFRFPIMHTSIPTPQSTSKCQT
jgi:hypothetical protein